MKRAVVQRKLERVDRAVNAAIERGELASAVILAKLGPELGYEGVFGAATLSPERRDARADTIYDLASLTKVMATTSAAWLLVADGKLKLDAPVAEALPAFAARGKEKVTFRHLLTHSLGLRLWRVYYLDLREKVLCRGELLSLGDVAREMVIDHIC